MLTHPGRDLAEKAARGSVLATLGHGEDAPMQRVPEDLRAVTDGDDDAARVRRGVSRGA